MGGVCSAMMKRRHRDQGGKTFLRHGLGEVEMVLSSFQKEAKKKPFIRKVPGNVTGPKKKEGGRKKYPPSTK